MGACNFEASGKGANAKDVFHALTEDARYMYGHGGYTGTIAEKRSFVMATKPEGMTPHQFMEHVWDNPEQYGKAGEAAQDKWGPAVCFKHEDLFYFFGYASE